MNIKKILSFTLIIIILAGIGGGGYYFITQQTKKKLAELEKETSIVEKKDTDKKKVPISSPRSIILPNQPRVEGKSSFYLKTNKESYNIEESFNVSVMVQASGEEVDGVEFLLNYNPEIIKIDELVKGSFFSLYPQKKVDQEKGTIRVIALQSPDKSKSLNQETVVVLPVTALKKGTVNFNFVREKTHIAAYGGQDLLKEILPLTVTVK